MWQHKQEKWILTFHPECETIKSFLQFQALQKFDLPQWKISVLHPYSKMIFQTWKFCFIFISSGIDIKFNTYEDKRCHYLYIINMIWELILG